MNFEITPGENIINTKKLNFSEEPQDYFLVKDNYGFKITICRRENDILIKSRNYGIYLNKNDFSVLTNSNFNSNDYLYQYIINIFENQKCKIKNIIPFESMNLLMEIFLDNQEKYIELSLIYNNNNSKIKKNNNDLNDQINQIKKEIENLNEKLKNLLYNVNKKIENNSININEKINGDNIKFINNISHEYPYEFYIDNTIALALHCIQI